MEGWQEGEAGSDASNAAKMTADVLLFVTLRSREAA